MKISEKSGSFSVPFKTMDSVEKEKRKNEGSRNASIFIGDLRGESEENVMEKRRKEIKEKAVKVLRDKFAGDLKRDERLDERRAKAEAAGTEKREIQERIGRMEDWLKNAPEEAKSDVETMKTYQEGIQQAKAELAQADNTIIAETANIRSEKLAKLGERYEQSMAYAVKQEEEILASGSDEIMSMIVQESIEHMDEAYQENIEKAQEQKEENAPEKTADQAEREKTAAKKAADFDEELQKLQKETKLMDEELKGLVVDMQL